LFLLPVPFPDSESRFGVNRPVELYVERPKQQKETTVITITQVSSQEEWEIPPFGFAQDRHAQLERKHIRDFNSSSVRPEQPAEAWCELVEPVDGGVLQENPIEPTARIDNS
jgi:hypothetical protein